MPLAVSDTPGVLHDQGNRSLWFSGSVLLGFENAADIFLTWENQHDFWLTAANENRWSRFALDSIVMTRMEPWDVLSGATLRRVHLFATSGLDRQLVTAARHDFEVDTDEQHHLWVCISYQDKVGDGDDLWVGLDEPADVTELSLTQGIE